MTYWSVTIMFAIKPLCFYFAEACFRLTDIMMRNCFCRPLLEDYVSAREAFPNDQLLENVLEALLISRKGLHTDPGQYVPQLLGRLTESDVSEILDFSWPVQKTFYLRFMSVEPLLYR